MTAVVLINAISNITTSISSLALLLHVFGDPENEIWDNKIKAWLAKIGLSVMICGATSNALTLSNPPVTEIILNAGIALTLFWLSWWQWELFQKMHKKSSNTVSNRKKSSVRVNSLKVVENLDSQTHSTLKQNANSPAKTKVKRKV